MTIGLLATFRLKPNTSDEFLAAANKMIQQASTEPGCHTYYWTRSMDDPNAIVIFELYADQAAVDAHVASGPMKQFSATMRELVSAPPDLTFLTPCATPGFVTRSSSSSSSSTTDTSFIWIARPKAKPNHRPALVETLAPIIHHAYANEPNTLSFYLLTDNSNDTNTIVFERYVSKSDLFDVHHQSNAFTTAKSALAEHSDGPRQAGAYEYLAGFLSKD